MLIVYTGNGKGKSTASFGLAVRAVGRGLRPAILQFIKTKEWNTGERQFFHAHLPDIKFYTIGTGFSWNPPRHFPTHEEGAQEAWKVAQQLLADDAIDVVILDELNVALKLGYLSKGEVVETLRNFKDRKHVVSTGRGAPEELIALADLVTEMTEIKHPYQKGIPATRGIDY